MTRQLHIIQQQHIDVQFEQFPDEVSIQHDIADLFYEQLLPAMETLFDELAAEKYTLIIESLEIDCGTLSNRYWKKELVEETLRGLRRQLVMTPQKPIAASQPVESRVEFSHPVATQAGEHPADGVQPSQQVLFFLQHGLLPWNSRIRSITQLEELFMEEMASKAEAAKNAFIEQLRKLARSQPSVTERLAFRFSAGFQKAMLEWLSVPNQADLPILSNRLAADKPDSRHQRMAWAALWKAALSEDKVAEGEIPFHKSLQKPGRVSANPKSSADPVYIQNAGLVILHPFLPELFRRLNLWNDKGWTDASSPHEGVQALEFLVSGDGEFPEFDLSLNKILCGMSIGEVWQPVEELPPPAKAECADLLQEVIGHWSILKNTSVGALQETFLQRNGKLTPVENGWLLKVEQKGVDILMNSLPWGIGTIKLPWADKQLFVEWT